MDTGDFCDSMAHVPILTTPRNSFDYNMCHKNRGICLIIENETFSDKHSATRSLGRRHGSHVDAERAINVFSGLGFSVYHQKDLTRSQIQTMLKSLAVADHRDSDCFVCIVLTHGDHGELFAQDGRYGIDLLFRHFLADNCPTLCGKPKLFFVQACQGGMLDDGVLVRQSTRDSTDTVSYFKIPTYADFMIAYSTLPGFYSFRNTEKGSWFIRSLCQVLEQYHLEFDLLTMMTLVSQRVAYDYTSQAATPELSQKKQVPCLTSMLTRRVYLTPKSLQLWTVHSTTRFTQSKDIPHSILQQSRGIWYRLIPLKSSKNYHSRSANKYYQTDDYIILENIDPCETLNNSELLQNLLYTSTNDWHRSSYQYLITLEIWDY